MRHLVFEIAPYQWDLHFDPKTSWYYGWDVASGVIWEPRGSYVTRMERDQ